MSNLTGLRNRNNMESWLVPISMLPGIGLLILSTVNLATALSTEITDLLKDGIGSTGPSSA